jgi:GT2 family glycosyltransferase
MNQNCLVSIITINFNQALVTNQLLESLSKVAWPNVEILVVDNGSQESDFNRLESSYSNVRIIRSHSNLGFAGGNNLGIKDAKGKYILLLNNDTIVEPNFIDPLIYRIENEENVGVVCPKIKYFDNPDTIQYAGFSKMNKITLRMHAIGYKQKDKGQYNKPAETHFAHGCALMSKRDVIQKAGLMPEQYFLYYEEQDWSLKIRQAGYKIWYEPESIVYHKESLSVQKGSPLKTYFLNRNRILFMRRNIKGIYKLLSVLYIFFISVPKNLLDYIIANNWNHLHAYWKGIMWNLTTLKTIK